MPYWDQVVQEHHFCEVTVACVGTTEEKKIDMIDNFLDLGRNLIPDNLFQAAFQTVRLYNTIT